jgi:type I restriction enzyme S subunit
MSVRNTENANLPDGWETTTIGDSLKIVRGISFPKDAKTYEPGPEHVACLRTANVQQEVEWDDLWFVPSQHVKRDEQYVQPLDILISTANSLELVGKVAQVKTIPYRSTLGAFISLIRVPSKLDSKFIFYQLASSRVQVDIRSRASTTTNISNISTSKLTEVPLVIPPRPEQERIVSRIEELFSDLEAGVAALERARAGLKRYKASVLKAAVEGKLTNGKLGIGDGEFSNGWRSVGLLEITSQIKDADHKMPKPADTDIPYVSTKDFIGDDDIDFENAKHISEEDFIALTRKIKPEPGDILLSRYGTVGQIRKVKTNRPFQASYSIAIIKPLANEVLSDFLVILLRSEIGQLQMRDNIRASSQPDLGLESIRKFVVPLPSLEEQGRIMAEVERRLSVVAEVESAVEAGLVRAGRLRQAVLRSAFEGRL